MACTLKKLQVDSKTFYDLIRTETTFQWTDENEKLFEEIKDCRSEETVLAISDTRYPFPVKVDASSIGVGSQLFQEFTEFCFSGLHKGQAQTHSNLED